MYSISLVWGARGGAPESVWVGRCLEKCSFLARMEEDKHFPENPRALSRAPPRTLPLVPGICPSIHAQYDWTTGVPDNGNDWNKFRGVPRSNPLRSLALYFV